MLGGKGRWDNGIVHTNEDASSNELPAVELDDF